ncbi:MAG: lysophospholipid acyltransferase family protein [Alphaproteobacteria bacterium]|nr:lysophospholipid acyltransferase family protein [Alphaproteobacteria bacterium]
MTVSQLIAPQATATIHERQNPVKHEEYEGFVTSAYPHRFKSPKSPSSKILASVRLLVIVVTILVLFPCQALLLLLPPPVRDLLPKHFHRFVAWVLGLQIVVSGEVAQGSQLLYVTNHASYLDIIVLGSRIKGVFISRSEVADWPIFGLLAKLQRSMFLERKSSASERGVKEIRQRMTAGDNPIMFVEATTTDGGRLAPFKSALLQVAMDGGDDSAVKVQPITITYTRLNGAVLGRSLRPLLSWYGDMTMYRHLFAMAGLGRITVELKFHPVLAASDFKNRKELSQSCFDLIQDGLLKSITGRG